MFRLIQYLNPFSYSSSNEQEDKDNESQETHQKKFKHKYLHFYTLFKHMSDEQFERYTIKPESAYEDWDKMDKVERYVYYLCDRYKQNGMDHLDTDDAKEKYQEDPSWKNIYDWQYLTYYDAYLEYKIYGY